VHSHAPTCCVTHESYEALSHLPTCCKKRLKNKTSHKMGGYCTPQPRVLEKDRNFTNFFHNADTARMFFPRLSRVEANRMLDFFRVLNLSVSVLVIGPTSAHLWRFLPLLGFWHRCQMSEHRKKHAKTAKKCNLSQCSRFEYPGALRSDRENSENVFFWLFLRFSTETLCKQPTSSPPNIYSVRRPRANRSGPNHEGGKWGSL